jgi:putative ABC transport system ATP-binding protein
MRDVVLSGLELRKRYGRCEALRGASVGLGEGEVVAVMGPSGSGKSTLLHCLAGVVLPDAGSVSFAGRRVNALSDADRSRLRRESFGFVFQFGQLVPELTALDNVALPLLLGRRSRRAARHEAAGWLERLEAGDLAGRRPGELSGGEGQRVAIARALVHRPRVVFADEPTGSLDSLAGEAILELLTRLAADEGTAVLVVTHDPRVAAYAHRDVAMRDGTCLTIEALA